MSTPAEKLRDMLDVPEPELEPKAERPREIRLYEAASDLNEVIGKVIDAEGELSPELEAELNRAEGTFLQKAERVWLKRKELRRSAEVAKMEAQVQAENARFYERAVERLDAYLMSQMDVTGQTKVHAPRARFWVQKNPPSYRWAGDTFEAIPERFRRTKVVHTLNVDAVKEAENAGEPIPAEVVKEQGRGLRGS